MNHRNNPLALSFQFNGWNPPLIKFLDYANKSGNDSV
jgi:hypothetical protein